MGQPDVRGAAGGRDRNGKRAPRSPESQGAAAAGGCDGALSWSQGGMAAFVLVVVGDWGGA